MLVAGMLLCGRAWGQEEQVKPYVLLLFDTSTSMLWDLCHNWNNSANPNAIINGDNSLDCPGNQVSCATCNTYGCGNGLADDGRLYKVKKGAYNVVSAFGEVTFGLARFRQIPATFTCNASADQRVGGWRWQDLCTGSAMGTGGNQADVLVGFSNNNQNQILQWMNNCDDYPTAGSCPGTAAPTAGCNLCPDCGTGCDLEIRAAGNTPIAGSLYDLRLNYFPSVFTADSQKLSCRPYKVILLTDGQNTCPGNPEDQASYLFTNPAKSVPVHVIGFGTDALKENLDDIALAGGTTQAIVVDNEVSLALAMASIVSESLLKETCNNADDDCDDLCDENWPEVAVTGAACTNKHAAQTCSAGLGICLRSGTYVCKADHSGSTCSVTPGPPNPGGEICYNGLDDNCDGAIDEGCLPCTVQPEICDGKDNDCDTIIDEGYLPVPCGSNIGECKQGTTACTGGSVVCNGVVPPTTELCDNKDNNCDTIVDNFAEACFPAGWGNGCQATGICLGVCKVGSRLCTNGAWGSCIGYQSPTTETCNGQDDDCDGSIDEGVTNTCVNYATCASYTTCSACLAKPVEVCDGEDNDCNGLKDDNPLLAGTPCGIAVGKCTKGTWACENGGLVCKGGVQPTTEICDNKDNDCNGSIDDSIAGLGGACGSSVGECKQGVYKCIGGKVVCSGEVGPGTEICDNKDNDCDGTADNNLASVACGSNIGECKQGTTQCVNGQTSCNGAVGPSPEICDGKDNNCNGLKDDYPTDEGTLCGVTVGECTQGTNKCVNGSLVCVGGNGPKTEICDGKDNDCNGTTDDNIVGSGLACGTDVGECTKGTLACMLVLPAGWTMLCVGGADPTSEICDAKDNDCDGSTDEDYPEKGKICGTNIGECKAGTYVCQAGQLSCQGVVGSTFEVCDGKDNDCNGVIDDNVFGEGDFCGSSVGECKPGTQKCVGGKFICVGEVGPSTEICDGKDNDCDGTADDMAECPGGNACVEGQCLIPCVPGEFTCPGGTKCVNGYCIPDKCAKVQCPDTQRCIDGNCVDKCSGVTCQTHEKCEPTTGICVDDSCLTKGCPTGKSCVNYECIDNPCSKDTCPQGQMCINGKCFDTCINVTCSAGQICVQGKCTVDPCADYECSSNFTCQVANGKPSCVPDPCRVVQCNPGEICHDGSCIFDPCKLTFCPEGFVCKVDHAGEPDCKVIEGYAMPTTTQILTTGAGGCAPTCNAGAGDGDTGNVPSLALFGLGLLWLRRRRTGSSDKGVRR